MNNIQTLKGFRDFVGTEAKKRQWLVEKIREVFERFGFEPLETPALEYESLLLDKYGEEADKLIFGFEDRGGRRVAMRYDQTIPLARVVSQNQNNLPLPYKRYQMQPVWRSEKPQKGRYREILQCDADIVGSQSVGADGEMLALCFAIYKTIGLENIKIRFNDRKTLFDTIRGTGIGENMIFSVIQTIDKLDKKSEDEVVTELIEKGIAEQTSKTLLTTIKHVEEPRELRIIRDIAQKMGVAPRVLEFSPTLARGLDYYTDMIFEGIIEDYNAGSLVGGGRYDKLFSNLVNIDLPAVGFAVGFDRTLEALEQLGKMPQFGPSTQVLVTIFSLDQADRSVEIANDLRDAGINTEVYLDAEKKLEAQLKYANKIKAPYVLVIGPNEIKNGSIVIKDMKNMSQEQILSQDLINKIKSKLEK